MLRTASRRSFARWFCLEDISGGAGPSSLPPPSTGYQASPSSLSTCIVSPTVSSFKSRLWAGIKKNQKVQTDKRNWAFTAWQNVCNTNEKVRFWWRLLKVRRARTLGMYYKSASSFSKLYFCNFLLEEFLMGKFIFQWIITVRWRTKLWCKTLHCCWQGKNQQINLHRLQIQSLGNLTEFRLLTNLILM